MLGESIISNLARNKYHRPKYLDIQGGLDPVAYLSLPFNKEDLIKISVILGQNGIGNKIEYEISEGWFYTRKTRDISGFRHAAVDFKLPYGFPVTAPCDGFAVSSYYSFPVYGKNGALKLNNGRPLRFGIGYFVQIYSPQIKRFVQLGHLSNIADTIPFSLPFYKSDQWLPTNHTLSIEEMTSEENPFVTSVKRGELIGYAGYSGLTWDEDYREGHDRPVVIDPYENGTWSSPHIHMDEFYRNYQTGKKDWRRDPYNVYAQAGAYPGPKNKLQMKEQTLFLSGSDGLPQYADSF